MKLYISIVLFLIMGHGLSSSLGFQEIAQVIVITDSLISCVVMTQRFAQGQTKAEKTFIK